jgi:hypothetical protein
VNIYIDESGSFVSASRSGSWDAVAAVVAAESARGDIQRALSRVRGSAKLLQTSEVKLNDLSESQYLDFLASLQRPDLVVFATATDAGLNTSGLVDEHQRIQVANARKNIPRMKFDGGRKGVSLLADQLEALSPQLYVQLVCQVNLLHDITKRSITYFVQRAPSSLREFRWRIDQKNTEKTVFEEAFEKIAPALLQSRSFGDPMIMVEGFDYSDFHQYEFQDGQIPDYLQTEYGLPVRDGINVQKLIRGNLRFEDSKSSNGIQAADLIASGLRRLLRRRFKNNAAVATALGRLTAQNQRGHRPIELIAFSPSTASSEVTKLVYILARASKPMLLESVMSRAAPNPSVNRTRRHTG